MSLTFYYASGSPYAWRVWLALEHKRLTYEWRLMSFSAGDLKTPAFAALNPRRRVPVLVDDGFSVYESAAIVEYLDDRYSTTGPMLFPRELQARTVARRLVREADEYLARAMERIVEEVLFKDSPAEWNHAVIDAGRKEFVAELTRFEAYAPDDGFFLGAAGAADFTLYPLIALGIRMEKWKPDLNIGAALGPKLRAWKARVEALPYFAKTIPPHWKAN